MEVYSFAYFSSQLVAYRLALLGMNMCIAVILNGFQWVNKLHKFLC